MSQDSREKAIAIWTAGVEAVKPKRLFDDYFAAHPELLRELSDAPRIIVLGAGKAGTAMAEALEEHLAPLLDRVEGIVNVPDESVKPLKKIRLHAARPMGSNHPTAAGVIGAEEMLRLAETAGPDDIGICLISGGGSALLPAPAPGITLEDKLAVGKLLHACGATIVEMNAVRTALSRIKGGQLARRFAGKSLTTLIISDVVGDPIDAIASGPTAPLPEPFERAAEVLEKFDLRGRVPPAVLSFIEAARISQRDKPLSKPRCEIVRNIILGNNQTALSAAISQALALGYAFVNLGAFLQGETRELAKFMAGIVRSCQRDIWPECPPAAILSGGETTVTLSGIRVGKGGRNQEFVLAMLEELPLADWKGVTVLSGGTDGEDGPTDAAGAVADEELRQSVDSSAIRHHLKNHDSYAFFDKYGGLLKTGLTGTNVMDLRVILIDPNPL